MNIAVISKTKESAASCVDFIQTRLTDERRTDYIHGLYPVNGAMLHDIRENMTINASQLHESASVIVFEDDLIRPGIELVRLWVNHGLKQDSIKLICIAEEDVGYIKTTIKPGDHDALYQAIVN